MRFKHAPYTSILDIVKAAYIISQQFVTVVKLNNERNKMDNELLL